MNTTDLLARMQAAATRLPRAQQQVLRVMLQDPRQALRWNVDALAEKAGVSMPTIGRLARSLGFAHLRDFKLALAQDLARQAPVHRSVRPEDSSEEMVHKVVAGAAAAVQDLEAQLKGPLLDQAAALLAEADRIDCFSVGATSAFMASDLQARLFRLGRVAHAVHDAHLQLSSAASQSPRGVVVAISHVGRMPSLLEAVDLARRCGAREIAITQPDTPLAALADVAIVLRVPPDAVMRVGTEAYIAHLLVIELLMLLLIKALGPAGTEPLARIRAVLQAHGQDLDTHPAPPWTWPDADKAGAA